MIARTLFGLALLAAVAIAQHEEGGHDENPCRRKCVAGDIRTCHFDFTIEHWSTFTRHCGKCPLVAEDCNNKGCVLGSGYQRPIITVNRQLPGPAVEVCQGDRVRVKVENLLVDGSTTTIHWHGIRQVNTTFYDGVPMVSQCPILQGNFFVYDFVADEAGTYLYHSHVGVQRADGVAGPIVVRAVSDPHVKLYDSDDLKPVFLIEWYNLQPAMYRYISSHMGDFDLFFPQAITVNGKAQFSKDQQPLTGDELPQFPLPVTADEYVLDPALRYRFRTIANIFMDCQFGISIEGHELVVIASDGMPLKAQPTKKLWITAGEKYDFVPYFTGEVVNDDAVYWMKIEGTIMCADTPPGLLKISYQDGVNPEPRTASDATNGANRLVADQVNLFNAPTNWNSNAKIKTIVTLDSLEDTSAKISRTPDYSFVFGIGFEDIENPMIGPLKGERGSYLPTPRINNFTMLMAPPNTVVSQLSEIPTGLFCNDTNRMCRGDEYCECIYANTVRLNSLVEIAIVDLGAIYHNDSNHPMHLHGHHFYIVGMDQTHPNYTVAEFKAQSKAGNIKRKFKNAVKKETVQVPSGGYTVVRFIADNPGPWMMHCHLEFHAVLGMATVFSVGNYPKVPAGFPKCGNWNVK